MLGLLVLSPGRALLAVDELNAVRRIVDFDLVSREVRSGPRADEDLHGAAFWDHSD